MCRIDWNGREGLEAGELLAPDGPVEREEVEIEDVGCRSARAMGEAHQRNCIVQSRLAEKVVYDRRLSMQTSGSDIQRLPRAPQSPHTCTCNYCTLYSMRMAH
jgi:hypothetical protein